MVWDPDISRNLGKGAALLSCGAVPFGARPFSVAEVGVPCRMLGAIPSLYRLAAGSTPLAVTIK